MTCCLTSGWIVSDAVMLVCWLLSCFVMCVFGLKLVVWCGVAFYLWLAAYLTGLGLLGLFSCGLVSVLSWLLWLCVDDCDLVSCLLVKVCPGFDFGFVWGFSGGGLLWWWCVF